MMELSVRKSSILGVGRSNSLQTYTLNDNSLMGFRTEYCEMDLDALVSPDLVRSHCIQSRILSYMVMNLMPETNGNKGLSLP